MAHHITSSRATAMMVNTAERGLVRVARPGIDEVSPRGGVGEGGRPADQSKVPWEPGALRQLDEGHIDDGKDSHGDAPVVSNFGLAVRKSSPTACTNNQSAGTVGSHEMIRRLSKRTASVERVARHVFERRHRPGSLDG